MHLPLSVSFSVRLAANLAWLVCVHISCLPLHSSAESSSAAPCGRASVEAATTALASVSSQEASTRVLEKNENLCEDGGGALALLHRRAAKVMNVSTTNRSKTSSTNSSTASHAGPVAKKNKSHALQPHSRVHFDGPTCIGIAKIPCALWSHSRHHGNGITHKRARDFLLDLGVTHSVDKSKASLAGRSVVNGLTVVLVVCLLMLIVIAVVFYASERTEVVAAPKSSRTPEKLNSSSARANKLDIPPEDSKDGHNKRMALVELINIFVGAGVLQLPFALYFAGWVGIIVLLLITAIMAFTASLVIESMRALETDPLLDPSGLKDYQVLGRAAFGGYGEAFVVTMFNIELFSYLSYFLVLGADNIPPLIGCSLNTAMLVSALVGLLTCCVPTRALAPISAIGFWMIIGVVIALIMSGVALPEHVNADDRASMGSMHGILTLTGITCVSFAGHPMLPSMYARCNQDAKDAYLKLVWVGLFISGIIYASFAALGFHFYGSFVEDSIMLNIGLALDGSVLPHFGIVKNVVLIAVWVKILAVYPFIVESIMVAFRASFQRLSGLIVSAESIRLALCLMALALALVAGQVLTAFAALVGCLMVMVTNVIFPALFYLRLCGDDKGKAKLALAACALVFGVAFGTYGTHNAIASMASGGDV